MRFEIRELLRGQFDCCARPLDVARGVVCSSPSSLEERYPTTELRDCRVRLLGLTTAKGEVWMRRVRCWSSLGVRLRVRELPDEPEVRDVGSRRASRS